MLIIQPTLKLKVWLPSLVSNEYLSQGHYSYRGIIMPTLTHTHQYPYSLPLMSSDTLCISLNRVALRAAEWANAVKEWPPKSFIGGHGGNWNISAKQKALKVAY